MNKKILAQPENNRYIKSLAEPEGIICNVNPIYMLLKPFNVSTPKKASFGIWITENFYDATKNKITLVIPNTHLPKFDISSTKILIKNKDTKDQESWIIDPFTQKFEHFLVNLDQGFTRSQDLKTIFIKNNDKVYAFFISEHQNIDLEIREKMLGIINSLR